MDNKYLDILPEVRAALNEGKPVVALESTIISHGMPYPQNVEMAKQTEDIIREYGAVPATIAVMDGRIKIGLTKEDLMTLATAKGVDKISRRDMADCIAKKKIGAVTVAGTMICAAMAGIRFFVTGGVGGVHRGYEEAMDVSQDLEELSKTNVTVICAGAKAILDLPRTLEYLETRGVPVVGYQTDELPAFYTRTSGLPVPLRADNAKEVVDMMSVREDLQLDGGVLVVNPIPEADAMDPDYINFMIESALSESVEQGIAGKEVTPFLLKTIVEKTEGKSLVANIALVHNNARIGAQLAVEYAKRKQ